MKEQIKLFAKELQIEYVGITSAEPMEELREILHHQRRDFGVSSFAERDIEKRVNPRCTLPDAKSIIVCLFPYYSGEASLCNLSKYACIPDYHKIVMERLKKICTFIYKHNPDATLMPFVDTGPLVDKYLAYRAGLGFFGKNTLLINETYGSFFFIGYMITNLPLVPDCPVTQTCMNCGMCITSCPGCALSEDGVLNEQRCVSYITQQKQMTKEQSEILLAQHSIYGCDVCQDVCPHNWNIPTTPITEWQNPCLRPLEKEIIAGVSNREFRRTYQNYPFSWRGKDAILKNFHL